MVEKRETVKISKNTLYCDECKKLLAECECPTPDYNDQAGEECLFGKAPDLTDAEFKQSLLQEYFELKRENEALKKRVDELEEEIGDLEAELEETPTEPAYDWRELD